MAEINCKGVLFSYRVAGKKSSLVCRIDAKHRKNMLKNQKSDRLGKKYSRFGQKVTEKFGR